VLPSCRRVWDDVRGRSRRFGGLSPAERVAVKAQPDLAESGRWHIERKAAPALRIYSWVLGGR